MCQDRVAPTYGAPGPMAEFPRRSSAHTPPSSFLRSPKESSPKHLTLNGTGTIVSPAGWTRTKGTVRNMASMHELCMSAEQDFRAEYWPRAAADGEEPWDLVHECVDGWVPIYTYDILALACDDLNLATAEPELGPAFDGTPTPVNIIAANIYERLADHLNEVLAELEGSGSE